MTIKNKYFLNLTILLLLLSNAIILFDATSTDAQKLSWIAFLDGMALLSIFWYDYKRRLYWQKRRKK